MEPRNPTQTLRNLGITLRKIDKCQLRKVKTLRNFSENASQPYANPTQFLGGLRSLSLSPYKGEIGWATFDTCVGSC